MPERLIMADSVSGFFAKGSIASSIVAMFAALSLADIVMVISLILSITLGFATLHYRRKEDKRRAEEAELKEEKFKLEIELLKAKVFEQS